MNSIVCENCGRSIYFETGKLTILNQSNYVDCLILKTRPICENCLKKEKDNIITNKNN